MPRRPSTASALLTRVRGLFAPGPSAAEALPVEEALRARTNLYAMLARTSRAVNRCRSADELFREVCDIAVATGGFRFAWVGVPRDGRVVPVASAGDDRGYLDRIVVTLDETDPRSHGPTGRAVRTGRWYVAKDFLSSPVTAPWHAAADSAGFGSSASFPFEERGAVVAALTVYAGAPDFFTDDLVETLAELAPSVSFGLDSLARERDRKRDEADLRLRDRAMQAIAQGIAIVDAHADDQPIVYASPSFERLTGYTAAETVGRNGRFLQGPDTDPAAAATIREAIAAGKECSVEILNYRKDGTPFWNALTISPVTDASGDVTHFVGVQTDVTEKRRMEERLRDSQRLEALGQLAGGIAHDFNNLLTVIMGNALLAVQSADLEARRGLDDILAAGDRATGLVRQLLAFSRQQPIEPSPVDLNDVVVDARRMLDRLIETTIEVRYELAGEPVAVVVDRGQIEQVLVNLAVNARDAMPEGGELTIRTGVAEVASERFGTVEIADTGTGIDEDLLEEIFLPFFTTKEVGKGTGLGLAAAYGIVDTAGGTISVESTPGAGSVFTVRLPLAAGAQGDGLGPRPDENGAGALQGVRVLLVEDDTSVRAIAEELLIAAGCELVLVATPERAIELTEDGEPFDVLITDLVMPRINGLELARTIRDRRPEMPVVFVSGYPQDKFDEAILLPNSAYVAKPFDQDTLQSAVAQLRNGGQAAS